MHPHDPNQSQQPQPGSGYPQQPQPGWTPPQPPKKSSVGKAIGLGCGGAFVGLLLIGGCAALLSSGDDNSKDGGKSTAAEDKPEKAPGQEEPKQKAPKQQKSQAEIFKECVAKEGTPTEKEAVKHVTKVTGADEQNNILDAAEVWTDYTGDMFGPHQKDAKLITSAFASCYTSENGLVSVYSKDGELIANGNF